MSAEDFDFDFTLEQVEDMLKGNSEAEEWYDAMCHVLPQYGITTEARVAAFIAQCGHESNNFKVLSNWYQKREWITNLVRIERIQSNTSVCLEIIDQKFLQFDDSRKWKFINENTGHIHNANYSETNGTYFTSNCSPICNRWNCFNN